MREASALSVSSDALLKRINRRLACEGETVRKSRAHYYQGQAIYDHNTGQYYRVDIIRNFILAIHIDLEELAQDLCLLRDWEGLSKEQ